MNRRSKRRLIVGGSVVGLVLLAGVGGTVVRQMQRERIAESSREKGLIAYEQQEYVEAVRRLQIYVRYDETDPAVSVALGDARRFVELPNSRHLLDSVVILDHAIQLSRDQGKPEHIPRALEILLDVHGQLNNWRELAETAEDLLALQPDNLYASRLLIEAHLLRGDNDAALAAADKLVENQGHSIEAYVEKAGVMSRARVPSREIVRFVEEDVAQRHAGTAGLAVIRASIEFDAGRPVAARDILVRAAEAGPTDGVGAKLLLDAIEEVAAATRDMALFDRSQAWLLAWLEDPALAASLYEVAAGRAWRLGDSATAIDMAMRARDALGASEATFAWGLLGAIETGLGDSDTGIALKGAFESAITPATRARAENWEEVIDACERLVAGQPPFEQATSIASRAAEAPRGPNGVAGYLEGVAQSERFNLDAASARLAQLSRQPSWRRARLVHARVLLGMNRPDRAAAILALDGDLTRTQAGSTLYGEVLAALSETGVKQEEIAATLRDELERNPEAAVLLAAAGRSALALGDIDSAIEFGRRLANAEAAQATMAAVLLADRLAEHDNALARAIVDRVVETAEAPLEFAAAAVGMAQQGRVDEARALVERQAAGEPSQQWDFVRIQLANVIDDAQSLRELEQVSSSNADDARIQTEILSGSVVWKDDELVGTVIGRLLEAEGEEGLNWRVFEARRLLASESREDARRAAQLFGAVFESEAGRRDSSAMIVAAEAFDRSGVPESELLALSYAADGDQPLLGLPRLIDRLQSLGRSEQAGTRLRQFVAMGDVPRDFRLVRLQLLERQGMLELAAGDIEALAQEGEAEFVLRRAIGTRPRGSLIPLSADEERVLDSELSPEDQVLAARLLARVGMVDEGLQRLRSLPATSDAGTRELLVAAFLADEGRLDEAIDGLLAYAKSDSDAQAWIEAARLYVGERRLDEAKDVLDQGLAALPGDPAIAGFRESLDEQSEASTFDRMARFTAAAGDRDDVSEGFARLAEICDRYVRGEIDATGAAAAFEEISSEQATLYPVWPLLIAGYEHIGESEKAAEAAQRAVRALPQDYRVSRDAAQLFMRLGEFDAALGMAAQWQSQAPTPQTRADAELVLGVAEFARGNARRTVALLEPHLDLIMSRAADNAAVIRALCEALVEIDRMEDAEAILLPLAQSDRQWAAFMASASTAGPMTPANVARASQWLETVGPWLEDDALGAAYVASGWNSLFKTTQDEAFARRAIRYGSTAIAAGGESWRLQAALGEAHELIGQPREAVSAYERSLELAGQGIPALLNNAAWVYTSQLGEHDKAIAKAQEAVRLAGPASADRRVRPTLAVFHHTLGSAQLAAGQADQALETFDAGIQLAETVSLRLGRIEALLALGRRSEAGDAYARMRPSDTWTEAQRERHASIAAVLGSG
jgi:tetratricopeptide (TPR) repeat protein